MKNLSEKEIIEFIEKNEHIQKQLDAYKEE